MPINVENLLNIKYDTIRREFVQNSNQWHFSIVDVLAISTRSTDSRNYWKVLKNRLKKTHNELVTKCNQLKMKANDGKFYMTDTGTEETCIEILKLISPENIRNFEAWCDTLDHKNSFLSNLTEKTFSIKIDREMSYPQSEKISQTFSEKNLQENKNHEIFDTENDEDLLLMLDGYKKENSFFIQAFIAGTDVEDLIISVTCNKVVIQGERKINKSITEEDFITQELAWGKFSRTIPLPEEIEINLSEVTEQHGEIKIKLPLINKERSKLIKIKSI